jgi:hypothetical protein
VNRALLFAALLVACHPEPQPTDDTDAPDTVDSVDTTDTLDPTDTVDTTDTVEDTDPSAHDALSMPLEPTHTLDEFTSAETCAACHPDHAAQWAQSNHAYAMVDPVYQKLIGLRQASRHGLEDRFCTQCHSAIGVRTGDISPGFSFDELDPLTMEGVTCQACHAVSNVARPFNSGHELNPSGGMVGNLANPAVTPAHATVTSDLLSSPGFCAGCHDVAELNGLPLERPYEEWLTSPAYDAGQTCVDCHAPAWSGKAALGGPDRTGLHDHHFSGVDLPMLDGFLAPAERDEAVQRIGDLLVSAGDLAILAPQEVPAGGEIDLLVTATNRIPAHNLPTGSTFLRQMWLDVTVTDALGGLVFRTGDLDANGDLRDWWSTLDPLGDHDLVAFHSNLIDPAGDPTFLPWEAIEMQTAAIPPLYPRTSTFFVPTASDTPGPLHVEARLRFRQVAPYVLRAVGMEDKVDGLVLWDIAVAEADIALLP